MHFPLVLCRHGPSPSVHAGHGAHDTVPGGHVNVPMKNGRQRPLFPMSMHVPDVPVAHAGQAPGHNVQTRVTRKPTVGAHNYTGLTKVVDFDYVRRLVARRYDPSQLRNGYRNGRRDCKRTVLRGQAAAKVQRLETARRAYAPVDVNLTGNVTTVPAPVTIKSPLLKLEPGASTRKSAAVTPVT